MIWVRNGKVAGKVSSSCTICRKLATAGSSGSLRAGTVSDSCSSCPRGLSAGIGIRLPRQHQSGNDPHHHALNLVFEQFARCLRTHDPVDRQSIGALKLPDAALGLGTEAAIDHQRRQATDMKVQDILDGTNVTALGTDARPSIAPK